MMMMMVIFFEHSNDTYSSLTCSNSSNEIVECDNCHETVHEGRGGVY